MIRERIYRQWHGMTAIVAATGPSLTEAVAERCRVAHDEDDDVAVLAVNDAWRLMPWADALYACDAAWWQLHTGTGFTGDKWSSHHANGNDKLAVAERYGLALVQGKTEKGFSTDPSCIHYGGNSGFQAINLAMLFGARRIVLVGFNLQPLGGQVHFFGDHPKGLRQTARYERFLPAFNEAAKRLPAGVEIINATPDSALKCFPCMPIDAAFDRWAVQYA
jgi:hypothetical protein